jgi:hypothetical protein
MENFAATSTSIIPTLNVINGCAPKSQTDKNFKGWGSSDYIVNKGYKSMQENVVSYPKVVVWNSVWHNDGMPKVNSFIWLLVHGRILMAENLRKRGIVGPSQGDKCRWDSLRSRRKYNVSLCLGPSLCRSKTSKRS